MSCRLDKSGSVGRISLFFHRDSPCTRDAGDLEKSRDPPKLDWQKGIHLFAHFPRGSPCTRDARFPCISVLKQCIWGNHPADWPDERKSRNLSKIFWNAHSLISQERYRPANPGRLVGRLAPSQSLLSNSDWVLVDPPAGRGLRVDSALG